ALWCAVRYKSIRPLLMYTVAYLPLGIIFLMKHGFGRMLSHPGAKIAVAEQAPEKLELFTFIGAATAYPSGHAANTIVWFGLAVLVFGAALPAWMRVFLLVGPPVVVGFTQTYMGLHWLTDAPAGYLLGILIIRSVRRVPWATVPLGPLSRLEPASPEMILSLTVAVSGALLVATKWLPAIILGVVICGIGGLWALKVMRKRR
ncbi:MAG: phosphatase PAP2 family protein, partial [Stackebrandtia sp.]